MELVREEGWSIGPPIFDGMNYGYWKIRMRCFIRATDEKAWRAVVEGWTSPIGADRSPKARTEWTSSEEEKFYYNKKALRLIYAVVSQNLISLISDYDSAMEAWNFLNDIFGENSYGHEQRLSQNTSKFEEMKMDVNEIERSFEVLTQSAPSVPEYVPEDVLERENYDSLEVIEESISTAGFGPVTAEVNVTKDVLENVCQADEVHVNEGIENGLDAENLQARENVGATVEVHIVNLECLTDSSSSLSFKSVSSHDCFDTKSDHSDEEITDANVLKQFRRMLKSDFISGVFIKLLKHGRGGSENLLFFERIKLEIAFVQIFIDDITVELEIGFFVFHKFGMIKCKMRSIFMKVFVKMTGSEAEGSEERTLLQNAYESLAFLYLFSRDISFNWAVSDDLSVKALDGEGLNALRTSLNRRDLCVM